MTSYRDEAHLDYILRSLAKLDDYFAQATPGKSWHDIEMIKDAVLRVLQTMTESCGKLSPEVKAMAPEMDWKNIMGFRNILAHDYLGTVDYRKVNEIVQHQLPLLKISISRIYKDLYDRH